MDAITSTIYADIIKSYKNISDGERNVALRGVAYDIEMNLEIYECVVAELFYKKGWITYPMEYFVQWLPYADLQTQEWYEKFTRYEQQKQTGNLDPDLNPLSLEGADEDIKLNLLKYCKPIRDQIVQMCNDKTLYDPV